MGTSPGKRRPGEQAGFRSGVRPLNYGISPARVRWAMTNHGGDCGSFPLAPTLSPRRGCRAFSPSPSQRASSGTGGGGMDGHAESDSPLSLGRVLGCTVVELRGIACEADRRCRGTDESSFPLTPALSPRERENCRQRDSPLTDRLDPARPRDRCGQTECRTPSPRGRGMG